MARRSRYVLSAAVAGACLTLSACGAGTAPAAGGSPPATTNAASGGSTSHFCDDATSFMRHIPSAPSGKHVSQATARANLHKVLQQAVKGFTGLKAEAPARLHAPLKKIIHVYKSDEKAIKHSKSLADISQAMVKGNASGSIAFQKVLKYIGRNCTS
ncbi:MAG TPA: hypothetical protein VFV41_19030 [Streptosporangiaceae bacterium]|nr:hypothetical protein [Streptosporangiaceae bacterium]